MSAPGTVSSSRRERVRTSPDQGTRSSLQTESSNCELEAPVHSLYRAGQESPPIGRRPVWRHTHILALRKAQLEARQSYRRRETPNHSSLSTLVVRDPCLYGGNIQRSRPDHDRHSA